MKNKIFKIILTTTILLGLVASTPLKKGYIKNQVSESDNPLVKFNRITLPIYEAGAIGISTSTEQNLVGTIDTNTFLFSSGFLLSGFQNGNLFVNGVQSTMGIYDYIKGTVDNSNDSLGVYFNSKDVIPFGKEWQDWRNAVELGAEFYDGDGDGEYNPIDKNENGIWDFDEDRPPLYGDVMTWSVYNDGVPAEERKIKNVGQQGINIKQTVWGFQHSSEFQKTVFIKYTIENSGSVSPIISGVNFSLAADPDVGYYANDYLSTDIIGNSISTYSPERDYYLRDDQLCMNSYLLQGPIVWDNYNSKGYYLEGENFELKSIPNMRNQNISATVNSRVSAHNYKPDELRLSMIGENNPDPCTDNSGFVFGTNCEIIPKQFIYFGNPISNLGWINTRGSDKAFFLTTDSFNLEVGKPVDIIFAISIGTGKDGLAAYQDGKNVEWNIKKELMLDIEPYPDVNPITITDDESIELLWDVYPQQNHLIEGYNLKINFEGYEVHMYNSPSTDMYVNEKLNKKLIGRYDVANDLNTLLKEDPIDLATEVIYKDGIQINDNTYTKRILHTVTWDPFNNEPLQKGKPYFFSITPFGVDINKLRPHSIRHSYIIPSTSFDSYFTNLPKIINDEKGNFGVVVGENENDSFYRDILTEHLEGKSDVEISYSIYDQEAVKDVLYEISFKELDTETYRLWMDVTNVSDNHLVKSVQITGDYADDVNTMTDGFLLNFDWVEPGKIDYSFSGSDKWFSDFNNLSTGVFYLGKDIEKTQKIFAVNLRQSNAITIDDLSIVELRFADTSKAFRYVRKAVRYSWAGTENPDSGFVKIPVSAYAISRDGTEKQLALAFLENAFIGDSLGMPDGKWNPGSDINGSKEYLAILNTEYSDNMYDHQEYIGTTRRAADLANGYMLITSDEISDSIKAIARSPWFNSMYVVGFNTPIYQPDFNPTGTLIIKPALVLTDEDKYYFKVKTEKTLDEKKEQFDKINVYPNPLFGYNSLSNSFGYASDEPFVTFSNLPQEVNIKIYSLSGSLIKSIYKNDSAASFRWNLKNESGMRVASGMYLAIVEVPNLGQRILKFAIIQPQKQVHFE